MKLYLQQLFFLCQKELIALVKDPRLKFMLVVPPILQGFLFGYAANYNLEEVPYAVVDESHGALARDLVAHIDAAPAFSRVVTLTSPTEVADWIDSGDILLAVVIPQDFDELIERGGQAPVQVIADGRNSSIAGLATGYVSQIVSAWNAQRMDGSGIAIEARTWYDPNQETQWNFVPSLMAMISFTQVMLLAGMSIAKEREQGTFDQLLVTPLHPSQILIGKAVPPRAGRTFSGCGDFLHRAVLVPDSVCGVAHGYRLDADLLYGQLDWARPLDFGDFGKHAASPDLRARAHDSDGAAFGHGDAGRKHAAGLAGVHVHRPDALRHRCRAPHLPRRRDALRGALGFPADVPDRRRDDSGSRLAVPP